MLRIRAVILDFAPGAYAAEAVRPLILMPASSSSPLAPPSLALPSVDSGMKWIRRYCERKNQKLIMVYNRAGSRQRLFVHEAVANYVDSTAVH